ncbi:MAG: M56 family metallopeptidase [Lachnospiraceae bacterium]|nr:M56 family metallopeptidase [Lachnospiraceae bacterium]
MEYLLVMSLSGSTMMGIYFLLKYLLKDKASSRLYYLIIKGAVLFFLIPLYFLKGWYRKIIWVAILKGQMKGVHIPVTWTQYAVHTGEKTYVNFFTAIQAIVVAIWLSIVCTMMVKMLLKYYRIRRLILKYESTEMTEKQQSFLAEIKKQYGVRRPVILCQRQGGDRTMTFGVCRPVIICDREIDSWEAEIHIRHEMVHIKQLDALWKMLTGLVVILHWWNPIAWVMRREFDQTCEYSCDEIVMQGKTREEVKVYLRLLIDEACAVSETKAASIDWQNNFANSMDNIKKGWKM